MGENNLESSKKFPMKILLVSTLLFILAILSALAGFYQLNLKMPQQITFLLSYSHPFLWGFNVVNAILNFLISVGIILVFIYLIKLKNWARVSAALVFFLAGLGYVIKTVSTAAILLWPISLVFMIFSIFMGIYLLFSKKVKEAFN